MYKILDFKLFESKLDTIEKELLQSDDIEKYFLDLIDNDFEMTFDNDITYMRVIDGKYYKSKDFRFNFNLVMRKVSFKRMIESTNQIKFLNILDQYNKILIDSLENFTSGEGVTIYECDVSSSTLEENSPDRIKKGILFSVYYIEECYIEGDVRVEVGDFYEKLKFHIIQILGKQLFVSSLKVSIENNKINISLSDYIQKNYQAYIVGILKRKSFGPMSLSNYSYNFSIKDNEILIENIEEKNKVL